MSASFKLSNLIIEDNIWIMIMNETLTLIMNKKEIIKYWRLIDVSKLVFRETKVKDIIIFFKNKRLIDVSMGVWIKIDKIKWNRMKKNTKKSHSPMKIKNVKQLMDNNKELKDTMRN